MAVDDQVHHRVVIDDVGQGCGDRSAANVKRDLKSFRAMRIKTLRQHRDAAQNQSLRKTQFEYPNQDEQEIYRQSSSDSGQVHLKPRGQDGNSQVANEFSDVPAGLMNPAVHERPQAAEDNQADEKLGGSRQSSPRARVLGQTDSDTGRASHDCVGTLRTGVFRSFHGYQLSAFRNNDFGEDVQNFSNLEEALGGIDKRAMILG